MSYILEDIATFLGTQGYSNVYIDTYAGDDGDNTAISDKIYIHSESSGVQAIQEPVRTLDFAVYVRRTTTAQAIEDSNNLAKLLRSNIQVTSVNHKIVTIQIITHPFKWSSNNVLPEFCFRCRVLYSDITLTS